jgi:hypothetical protein
VAPTPTNPPTAKSTLWTASAVTVTATAVMIASNANALRPRARRRDSNLCTNLASSARSDDSISVNLRRSPSLSMTALPNIGATAQMEGYARTAHARTPADRSRRPQGLLVQTPAGGKPLTDSIATRSIPVSG